MERREEERKIGFDSKIVVVLFVLFVVLVCVV